MAETRLRHGATLGRLAVVLAGCSIAVHLVLADRALDRSTSAAVLLLAMAGACLACAPSLWRGGKVHSWMTMLGLTGAMLYTHWTLCFACGPTVHTAYDEGILGHFTSGGLGSLAMWLMVAEMLLSVVAVARLLGRSTEIAAAPAEDLTQPELVRS